MHIHHVLLLSNAICLTWLCQTDSSVFLTPSEPVGQTSMLTVSTDLSRGFTNLHWEVSFPFLLEHACVLWILSGSRV